MCGLFQKQLTEFRLGILHGSVSSVLVPKQQKCNQYSTTLTLINRNKLYAQANSVLQVKSRWFISQRDEGSLFTWLPVALSELLFSLQCGRLKYFSSSRYPKQSLTQSAATGRTSTGGRNMFCPNQHAKKNSAGCTTSRLMFFTTDALYFFIKRPQIRVINI